MWAFLFCFFFLYIFSFFNKDGCWVDFVFNYFLFSFLFIYNFSMKQPKEHACIYFFFLLVGKHHVQNIFKPFHIL